MTWIIFRGVPRPRPRLFCWDPPRALLPEASALWCPPRPVPEYEPGAGRVMVRVMYQMGVVRELWRRGCWSWPAP